MWTGVLNCVKVFTPRSGMNSEMSGIHTKLTITYDGGSSTRYELDWKEGSVGRSLQLCPPLPFIN